MEVAFPNGSCDPNLTAEDRMAQDPGTSARSFSLLACACSLVVGRIQQWWSRCIRAGSMCISEGSGVVISQAESVLQTKSSANLRL